MKPVARILDAITLLLITGYALFATAARTVEADFFTDWGLKAKEFARAQTIDWRFLEHPWNAFAHVDYPIFLPLLYDVQSVIAGHWDDRWLGVLFVAFGLSALLVVRDFLRDETEEDVVVSLAGLALMSSAFVPWIGIGEGPLLACGTTALLYIRRGLRHPDNTDLLRGAVFLGLAASYKNEGIALIAAAALGIAVVAWKRLPQLWPAAAIAGPWMLIRRVHHLQTDLTSGPMLDRMQHHFGNLAPMIVAIGRYTAGKPLFWLAILLAIAMNLRAAVSRERFLLITITTQVCFFLGAYMVTPHDVTWHVQWSWERVVSQLALTLGFMAVALLAPRLTQRSAGVSPAGPPTSRRPD